MKNINSPPTYTISLSDQIYCFELSSYEKSQNLAVVVVVNKIILGLIKFPEETDTELVEWHQLKEISHELRCNAVAFAPETSLSTNHIRICAASSDYNLYLFRSNLSDSDTVQILKGHSSYINSIAWDPEGKFLATCSDDHSCIIWNNHEEFKNKSVFYLKSAGMTVKWHADDTEKIMVAEKRGVIHMYNVISQQIVMSVETQKSPLLSADWALSNRLYVVALAAGEIITWNLKHSCLPLDTKAVHENCGTMVKFSPNSECIVASVGRPDVTLKVLHLKSQITQLESPLKLFGGLDWHYRLPYVAAGYDRKICFWRVHTK